MHPLTVIDSAHLNNKYVKPMFLEMTIDKKHNIFGI